MPTGPRSLGCASRHLILPKADPLRSCISRSAGVLRNISSAHRAKGGTVAYQAARSRWLRLTGRHLARVGIEQHQPAPTRKAGRETEDGAEELRAERSSGGGTDMRSQTRRQGKRLTATAVPGAWDLRWRPEASPSFTSGPSPGLCRLCSGPPAFAVNPRWGYARQKFRKIRFRFLFAGQGTFLPASGAL